MKAPRLSLSQRLFLLTAAALVPGLAILGFNEVHLRQSRAADLHVYSARMSELASLEMERVITGAAALMIAVATSPSVEERDLDACDTYLAKLQATLPQVNVITITDGAGESVCSSDATAGHDLATKAEGIREELDTKFFSIGNYVETAKGPGLLMGTKAHGAMGQEDGYVLATIGVDYLGGLLRERSFTPGSALTVADRNGVILAREPLPEQFVGTRIPDAYLPLVTAERGGTIELTSRDGTRRIMGYQPATSGLGLYVSAGVSTEQSFAPINEAFMRGIALAITGGALAFLLAWLFGRSFIQAPVNRLVDTIDAWRSGDRSARTGMQQGTAEIHRVGNAIDHMLDEIEQRQASQEKAESHRDLLARELNHRVKNLLATVQAVARQTFKDVLPHDQRASAFIGRLETMADAHNLLTDGQEDVAELFDTVRTAIAPFNPGGGEVFEVDGPDLTLTAKATLSLAMALHELCTNAAKYGSLSSNDGQVLICWTEPERDRFTLQWKEQGGPPVTPPTKQGFGSRMIVRALAADLGAKVEFDYAPDGLVCTIDASAKRSLAPDPAVVRVHA